MSALIGILDELFRVFGPFGLLIGGVIVVFYALHLLLQPVFVALGRGEIAVNVTSGVITAILVAIVLPVLGLA